MLSNPLPGVTAAALPYCLSRPSSAERELNGQGFWEFSVPGRLGLNREPRRWTPGSGQLEPEFFRLMTEFVVGFEIGCIKSG